METEREIHLTSLQFLKTTIFAFKLSAFQVAKSLFNKWIILLFVLCVCTERKFRFFFFSNEIRRQTLNPQKMKKLVKIFIENYRNKQIQQKQYRNFFVIMIFQSKYYHLLYILYICTYCTLVQIMIAVLHKVFIIFSLYVYIIVKIFF